MRHVDEWETQSTGNPYFQRRLAESLFSVHSLLLSGGIHYLCALLNIFFLTLTTVLMFSIFSNATEETKEREKVTKEIAGTHGDGLRLLRSHRNKPQRHNQSFTQQHALTQW